MFGNCKSCKPKTGVRMHETNTVPDPALDRPESASVLGVFPTDGTFPDLPLDTHPKPAGVSSITQRLGSRPRASGSISGSQGWRARPSLPFRGTMPPSSVNAHAAPHIISVMAVVRWAVD
ncbi:hypothetical protein NM688_g7309 [Phlebia brevispora]|uniref:Uncharacterized protein n=1 Tax=Phlebia brevispora TaxID=194682 RepID=A0ACC1S6W3_9APHY|nr:hypothetical protein NM688_g7309 [Phlebia brevispora]